MPHIEHVLFMKLRTMNHEEWNALFAMAMGLKSKIPGVLDINFGPHNPTFASVDRSGGYTHGFRVKFADAESLKAYAPHEEHQKFVTLLGTLREAAPLCLDWVVDN